MTTTSDDWLERCLSRIPRARVTVFGDFALDAYWTIDPDASELSLETGLPVRRVRRQRYSLGGAGNICANLADLGVGGILAVGLVGNDLFGRRVVELLTALGVDCRGLLQCQEDWQTAVYAKPHLEGREQSRIDFGAFNKLGPSTADRLAERLRHAAAESDAVILNQQVPASQSDAAMIERLNAVAAEFPGVKFLVDSRHRAELYRGCILKVNAHEAARLAGHERPPDERIPAAMVRDVTLQLARRTGKAVFVTRGANGIVLGVDGEIEEIPGIQIVQSIDPVGAGDTTMAAIAAVLGAGDDALTAARFANVAASITVRKLQTTGTANPDEIRAVGPNPDYVYLPELADDPRGAKLIDGTEIEQVRDLPGSPLKTALQCVAGILPAETAAVSEGNPDVHRDSPRAGETPATRFQRAARPPAIRHALFDHDGTISTLRQGWEQIMRPMMIRAILGGRYETADETLYHKVADTVAAFIDKTTGVQTLSQMQALVDLVRQFQCVPEDEILDMHGYKALYDAQLGKLVASRIAKLRRGELEVRDFQIAGAVQMLSALHGRGVTLHLASGTDQAQVRAEAEALGYAHFFGGRIHGAADDVRVDAKRAVLENLFRTHGLGGPELVTFGDGPVEIRLTHKAGGIAVGIASDEVRRYGLSAAKRSRLIRAGADLIVPDLTQTPQLLALLQVV